MNLKVHYQGLDASPWLEEFIIRRISKLERFLGPYAKIQVCLRFEDRHYMTSLAIYNHRDYCYIGYGENLYESFIDAVGKATRWQGEESRRLKEKIHRKIISVEW